MGTIVFSQSNSAGSGYATNTKYVRITFSESYDAASNRSTVTLTKVELRSPATLGNVPFFGKVAFNGTVVADFEGYSSTVTASADTYCEVIDTIGSYGSITVQHNDETGAASMSVELRGASSGYQNWFAALYTGGKLFGIRTVATQSVALTTRPRGSAIASSTASVATLGTYALSMTRRATTNYHIATFTCGGTTLLTSGQFDTALSFAVPRSWFSAYPNAESLAVTVSVQTYNSGGTAIGSPVTAALTVTADADMRPVVSQGWATLAPYNTGAVVGITGYVKSYSRAEATFDRQLVDMSNAVGASISSFAVTCQGETDDQHYLTPVLAATSVTVVCTVTDSRGRSASESFTLAVMDYARPTLTGIEIFRCDSSGARAEEGTYYSAKATLTYSPLDGQNNPTLTAAHAAAGGAYGAENSLASGTASVIGQIRADASYTVRLTGRDSLGNEVVFFEAIPTRRWAMKFRPNGRGVAFGKAAETDNCLELDAGWDIRIGGMSIFSRLYPVGSIYLSVNNVDPGTLFGGTWEQIKDCFLLAAGQSYSAGTTGGEARHTLTEAEMPDHRHEGIYWQSSGKDLRIWGLNNDIEGHGLVTQYANGTPDEYHYMWTAQAGGGQAHNNMPPYLAVYVWKRTA